MNTTATVSTFRAPRPRTSAPEDGDTTRVLVPFAGRLLDVEAYYTGADPDVGIWGGWGADTVDGVEVPYCPFDRARKAVVAAFFASLGLPAETDYHDFQHALEAITGE